MSKKKRWEMIYDELKDDIISGTFPAGATFPTNTELMKRFDCQRLTVQSAVNALIQDGLVLSRGKSLPRHVRMQHHRAVNYRKGGFQGEFGKKANKRILTLEILDEIPKPYRDELRSPALFLHTEQYIEELQVAVSRSYIPSRVPIRKLKKLMEQADASLYGSLKYLGFPPTSCSEGLICDFATIEERNQLHLPAHSNIPVVRIVRRTLDDRGELVELCSLVYRADCYEFQYQFDF